MMNTLFRFFGDSYGLDLSPLPKLGTGDQGQLAWTRAMSIVFATVAAIALLMIVINGYLYITSSGDPQRTAQARQGLLYSVIGLLVVLLAAVIVTFAVRGIG
jgi:hypothetical protein